MITNCARRNLAEVTRAQGSCWSIAVVVGTLFSIWVPSVFCKAADAQELIGNPYSVFHSMETLDGQGETVKAIRIPILITLRSWQENALGLRLRLAATFAVTDLTTILDGGFDLEEVAVTTFVPGVELVYPFAETMMLRPFVDVGVGANDATDTVDLLLAMGLRTEFIFRSQTFIYGLEPGFRLSANTAQRFRDNSVLSPYITASARLPLGTRIKSYVPDVGVYFDGGYDFQSLELTSLRASSEDIGAQFETGIGFGFSQGRPKIGPFTVPRLRVGYRFGDLEGFRVRIGGDWLTVLPEQ